MVRGCMAEKLGAASLTAVAVVLYNSCCESLSRLTSVGKSRDNPSKGACLQRLTF
jgi:hypothetical protein